MSSRPDSLLNWALAYAERLKLPVFPLVPRGKVPLISVANGGKGHLDATLDAAQIREWWTRHPDANIGIAVPEGRVVVDIDQQEALGMLAAQGLTFPETATAQTARGYHFWFRLPDGVKVAPRVGILPGVDIRGVGSYVVAPPSIHETGVLYLWEEDRAPKPEMVAECPSWLVQMAQRGASHAGARAASGERVHPVKVLQGVPEGNRDAELFRYACYLRGKVDADGRAMVTREEAEALILAAANACKPAFPHLEALRKVEQAWKYPGGREAGMEPQSAGHLSGTPLEPGELPRIWTLEELLAADLPEPEYLIHQILPADGALVLFSADPKTGKSWAASNMAAAMAYGGPALGCAAVTTKQCASLYLDLEQPERQSKKRWERILRGEKPPHLYISYEWKRTDAGGLEDLGRFLDQHPEVRCIWVDDLNSIFPTGGDARKESGNAYHREGRIMQTLRGFARLRNVSIVCIWHNNNQGKASGTAAMRGVPHALWELTRKQGSREGTLAITGRVVEEAKLDLVWTPETGTWSVRAVEAT